MEMWDILSSYQTWIVFIVVFIVSYNYIVKESWRGLPPGPPTLPLVGSLPFLGSDLREPFRKMTAKYGDVFTIYLGRKRVVVLNGYDTFREAHLKLGHTFTARPDSIYNTIISKKQGVIASSGPLWREQRNFTIHTLRDLGFGRPVIEARILEEIEYFMKELHKQKDIPFYPISLLQKSVANVIFAVLFGKRMNYDDADYIRFVDTSTLIFDLLTYGGILEVFPFLRQLPGDLFRIKELLSLMDGLFQDYQQMIDQHKEKTKDLDNPTDFIGMYLQKIREQDDSQSPFTEEQLCHVVHDLFMGGSETASTTLAWAILYMAIHPDIQTRLHTEIDDVIGTCGVPSMQHRPKMPFTVACLNEIQRLGDVAALASPRVTTSDVMFNGYLIPEGTMILNNVHGIHMDPNLWPEPEKFQPERFLDSDGELVKREGLIPFMIGKRSCIAENLALMELFLYFTSMMANFQFRVAPGYPEPDTRGVLAVTNVPKPFYVMADSRQ